MKFEYSPGLFGYGAKGTDGSAGISGLSLYFTDYNAITDIIRIQSAIENDEVLISTVAPETKLPGGRSYITGDLFVIPNGTIYQINAETNTYTETDGNLSKADYFDQYFYVETDNGYIRYHNIYNASTNYIIDNVMTSTPGINYTLYPGSIYNIDPKEFARIEYTNIINASSNAFSVYSSGATTVTDDKKSIAIIRDVDTNTFKIGNLDKDDNLRSVNLILDVSLLIHTKDVCSNYFSHDTPSGEILTNNEIYTNLLFDPNFTSSPASFKATPTFDSIIIEWWLSHFTLESSIIGTLYFMKAQDPSGSYYIDSSIVNPLVLYDLDVSGTVTISDLPLGATYQYYLTICKDGWERMSAIKSSTTSATVPELHVNDPSNKLLSVDASGWFSTNSSYGYTVDISTDSYTGWNVTSNPVPDWITITPKTGPSGNDTFDVSISRKTTYGDRISIITISSEAPDVSIGVTQTGLPTSAYITFNTDGSILLSGLGSILIDISLYGYAYAYAGSEENGYYNSSADIDYINAGPTSNNLVDTTAEAQGTPEYDSSTSIGYFADFGLSNSSTCEIQHAMTGYYAGIDGETMAYGYVKITAAKISGTSTNVTILYNKWDIDQFGVISVLYEA